MKALLLLQYQSEFRKKSILLSLILYLLCLVFINYFTLGMQGIVNTPAIWSALFWIALLSTAVNTIAKSFSPEKGGREIYFYSLVSPEQLILAKTIYGTFLCFAFSLTGFLFFSLLLTNPIQNTTLFVTVLLLSSIGFSSSLSILSAISSKTDNSSVIMAVLSFPVTIGILLMSIKATKNAIDGLGWAASTDELLTLVAINLLVTAVSYLLFPYIWRS